MEKCLEQYDLQKDYINHVVSKIHELFDEKLAKNILLLDEVKELIGTDRRATYGLLQSQTINENLHVNSYHNDATDYIITLVGDFDQYTKLNDVVETASKEKNSSIFLNEVPVPYVREGLRNARNSRYNYDPESINDFSSAPKNVLRVQRQEFATIRSVDRSDGYPEVKYTHDENRPITKGYLLFCNECKQYKLCEIVSNLVISIAGDEVYFGIDVLGAVSSCCNKYISKEDIHTYTYQEENRYFHDSYLFDDVERKDKITISSIDKKYVCYNDKFKTEYLNNRVVFNLKSGRTYLLPEIDLYSKRKKGRLISLGLETCAYRSSFINISIEDFLAAGRAIEKYNRAIDDNGLIPFDEYADVEIRRMFKTEKFFSVLCGSKKYDDGSVKKFINNYALTILTIYNCNPYITAHQFVFCNEIKKYMNKSKKVKITKNKKLYGECLNNFKEYNKIEKKYLSHMDYFSRRTYIETKIKNLKKLKDLVFDINNRNKILLAEKELDLSMLNSDYYTDLCKKHGESSVINAILKLNKEDTIEYFEDTTYAYRSLMRKTNGQYRLPVKRLRLKELHDKINSDYNKVKRDTFYYKYTESIIKALNLDIDGYEFRIAESSFELIDIGSAMNICVGSYNYKVNDFESIIVHVRKDNNYIACLEIKNNGMLIQAKGIRNTMLKDEDREALVKYCNATNSLINTFDCRVDNKKDIDILKNAVYKAAINKEEEPLKVLKDKRSAYEILNGVGVEELVQCEVARTEIKNILENEFANIEVDDLEEAF